MRVKLSALHAAIDFDYTPEELVTRLGDVGIEIESTESTDVLFRDVFVARIMRTVPHPTHDRLQIVDLDLGPRGTTSVCTAATNVREGDIIPVSYTHLRAHETRHDLVCRLLLEKQKTRTLFKTTH